MTQTIDTVIIGGGQAGLATSYLLGRRGREHVVLEQAAAPGNAWRNYRWDSFTLVTPNWFFRLPGAEYDGNEPNGFMPRDQIVARFERYVEQHRLPVQFNARVDDVEPKANGGYRLKVGDDVLDAANVVVATGLFQQPRVPEAATALSPRFTQLHSAHYRNAGALPPGAVLVVGSAQSGSQIAEELYQSGRTVYFCVSSAGRAPRRYRGRDIFYWLDRNGFLDRTAEKLPSPKARFAGNPHLSGKNGGRDLNLHQFARDGVVLLGRLMAARDTTIWLTSDLKKNLAAADKLEAEILKLVDTYVEQNGLDAPEEERPQLRDGYEAKELTELDLAAAGISTIIWATGYAFDFSLVQLPVRDEFGYPLQKRGASAYAGLYFVGLPWLTRQRSGLLHGVADDAAAVASAITGRDS